MSLSKPTLQRFCAFSIAAGLFFVLMSAPFMASPATAADASEALIKVNSPYTVGRTVSRLTAGIEERGARVFATIDHAQGAARVGMELTPAVTLIFGNPRLGTPVMQAAPTMALDLPLKIAVIETSDGVQLVYQRPSAVAETHGLDPEHPGIARMTMVLRALTAEAVAE